MEIYYTIAKTWSTKSGFVKLESVKRQTVKFYYRKIFVPYGIKLDAENTSMHLAMPLKHILALAACIQLVYNFVQ